MTLRERILKVHQSEPTLTAATLAKRFSCSQATVYRALEGHRTEDPRRTKPARNGRKFVPLPEIRIGNNG